MKRRAIKRGIQVSDLSFGVVLVLALLALAMMEAIPLLSWVLFWILAGIVALAGWLLRGRVISMSAAPDEKSRMDAIDDAEREADEP